MSEEAVYKDFNPNYNPGM